MHLDLKGEGTPILCLSIPFSVHLQALCQSRAVQCCNKAVRLPGARV